MKHQKFPAMIIGLIATAVTIIIFFSSCNEYHVNMEGPDTIHCGQ